MEQILLLRAGEEDAEDVLNITKTAFEIYANEVRKKESIEALRETICDVLRDIGSKHVYIAKIDGETVGSVRFDIRGGGIAYLSRFAMKPEAQNFGIGGLLLEKVKLECIALGVRAITLHTASKMRSTVAFYLKNGYYIHSITKDKDYIRAFMVNELVEMDEMYDYEAAIKMPV